MIKVNLDCLIEQQGIIKNEYECEDKFIKISSFAHDRYGNVIGIKKLSGSTREIVYDKETNSYPVTETLHFDGKQISAHATYDYGLGNVITSTDYNGNISLYKYDVFGRLKAIHKPNKTGSSDPEEIPTIEYFYKEGNPLSYVKSIVRHGDGENEFATGYSFSDGLGRRIPGYSQVLPRYLIAIGTCILLESIKALQLMYDKVDTFLVGFFCM